MPTASRRSWSWQSRDVVAMISAIRDSLRQRGITLFPYVFIAKQSELDEEENEEENERRGEG
jgi:nitric oxide synthase oxygenase domain/subunit